MPNERINAIVAGIVTLAFSGTLALTSITGNRVKICEGQNQNCITVTREDYQEIKRRLAGKMETGTDLTWEEYRVLIAVLNAEIKEDNGMRVRDVEGEEDIKQALINKLREE
jgi:hypothetical protein